MMYLINDDYGEYYINKNKKTILKFNHNPRWNFIENLNHLGDGVSFIDEKFINLDDLINSIRNSLLEWFYHGGKNFFLDCFKYDFPNGFDDCDLNDKNTVLDIISQYFDDNQIGGWLAIFSEIDPLDPEATLRYNDSEIIRFKGI